MSARALCADGKPRQLSALGKYWPTLIVSPTANLNVNVTEALINVACSVMFGTCFSNFRHKKWGITTSLLSSRVIFFLQMWILDFISGFLKFHVVLKVHSAVILNDNLLFYLLVVRQNYVRYGSFL